MSLAGFGERWAGTVVAVLGGGPGLTADQISACSRAGLLLVAINDAIGIAPDARMLYFADRQWYLWPKGKRLVQEQLRLNDQTAIVTLENQELAAEIPGLISLKNDGTAGLCNTPGAVKTGHNGGYQALNLLIQLRVKRALLLGFNMKKVWGRSHWFGDHPVTTQAAALARSLEQFHAASEDFSRSGMEIINCTPDSALRCFRKMQIEEALQLP